MKDERYDDNNDNADNECDDCENGCDNTYQPNPMSDFDAYSGGCDDRDQDDAAVAAAPMKDSQFNEFQAYDGDCNDNVVQRPQSDESFGQEEAYSGGCFETEEEKNTGTGNDYGSYDNSQVAPIFKDEYENQVEAYDGGCIDEEDAGAFAAPIMKDEAYSGGCAPMAQCKKKCL